MRRFALVVVGIAVLALVGAFVPGVSLVALVVGVLGLVLGILCLIIDGSFNLMALIGTVASSAAVTLSIIMAAVYGA